MSEDQNQATKKRLVKTIQHSIKLDSEQLYNYLGEEGGKSQGALERVGSLLRMLAKEEDLGNAVKNWLDDVFEAADQEVQMLLAQKETLKEKLEGVKWLNGSSKI